MTRDIELEELREKFSDLINYDSEDPLSPIDPYSYKTPEGDSCLHIAALRGDCRAIELLLQGGLDIDEKGDLGNTPLHYASSGHHRGAFDLLLERGANTSIKNELGKISGDY